MSVLGLLVVLLVGYMTLDKELWFPGIKPYFPFAYMGYGRLINDYQVLPRASFTIVLVHLLGMSLVF